MKIIIRGFIICTMALLFIFIHLITSTRLVKEDELNVVATEAMSTTQISAREQIEDRIYETSNARCNVNDTCYLSNDDYLSDLENNLKKLIKQSDNYELRIYGIDYEKGLLDVEFVTKYQIFGKNKELSVRKTSIVNIEEYED